MSNEVMIVAGEASGDLHGARLIHAMRELDPALRFCGIGGTEMRQAGVELLYDAAKIAVVGVFEVVSHLGDIICAQMRMRARLVESRPALLILIDFPDFNLLLARKAKKLGIPVFYYISPQVWAWRSGRVKTIGRLVDGIGVILPFEEAYYRRRGVEARYVGHPLLDSVSSSLSRRQFCEKYQLDGKKTLVGLLPGSRIKEIKHLLPEFLRAAELLHHRCPDKPIFLVPRASTISEQDLCQLGIDGCGSGLDIRVLSQDRYELMAACDAVVAASGTVTLELLLLDTPMVVTYKLSPMTYWLGTMLVKIDYFSLVNLIGKKRVVPELLQQEVCPTRIAEELYRLLFDSKARQSMLKDFTSVRRKLGAAGASGRAAELALQYLRRD